MLDPLCPLPNIDFDTWSKLASTDPQAFEEKRKQLVEQVINQAPEDRRDRLRCLQWRIDRIRELSHTPMAACLKISKMMWDSVLGPDGLLELLQKLGDSPEFHQVKPSRSQTGGQILPFPARSDSIKVGF